MNVLKATIAAVSITACCLGNQLPASSAPTTCALRDKADGYIDTFPCDHSMRVNANGHKINDIVFFNGNKRYDVSIILWTQNGNPEYAEVFINGQRTAMQYYIAKNNAACVSNNDKQLCFH